MRPAAARGVLAALLLGAGCAHPAVDVRPAPATAATGPTSLEGRPRTPARRGPNPTGAEVARILGSSGLAFDTVAPGRQWRLVFAGRRQARVTLYVLYGGQFTTVVGRLFTVPETAGVGFYRALARKNYDFDQLKLSVDDEGGVFASFEVPTRILDERELLENIFGLAGAMDEVGAELARFASPDGGPLPAPDDDAPPPRLPATRGRILEALRTQLRPLLAQLP